MGKFKKKIMIVGCKVKDTARYGRLEIYGDNVIGLLEKQISGPGNINAGCYVISKEILKEFKKNIPFSFEKNCLAMEIQNKNVQCHISKGFFIDIGIPKDYETAQKIFANTNVKKNI